MTAADALLCFRLTTDTGSIAELWELDTGEFELLFAEAHLPREVVYAATFRAAEVALLAEKLATASGAALASGAEHATCTESADCDAEDWHYWRCPKHPDYRAASGAEHAETTSGSDGCRTCHRPWTECEC